MMRFLVCQNSVPYKSAPCAKWLLLLVSFSYFPHNWISAGNKEKCLFSLDETDDIFNTITYTAAVDKWCFAKCIPVCLASLFCVSLFPFHSFCNNNKNKSPRLNRKELFVLIFCLGTKREWEGRTEEGSHWERMVTDTHLSLEELIQKREWQ